MIKTTVIFIPIFVTKRWDLGPVNGKGKVERRIFRRKEQLLPIYRIWLFAVSPGSIVIPCFRCCLPAEIDIRLTRISLEV